MYHGVKSCYSKAMITLFAHAGEDHGSASESAAHVLEYWYFALPLFLMVVALAGAVAFMVFKRSFTAAYIASVGVLLAGGIFMYDKSPVVSTVAITIGLLGSLLIVLTLLSPPQKASKK